MYAGGVDELHAHRRAFCAGRRPADAFRRVQSSPLVRAVFALLVLATVAAFFVTQQLKSEFPLVLRFAAAPARHLAERRRRPRLALVGFDLSEPAEVTFSVIDAEGNDVRELVDDRALAGDTKHRFRWDGRDDDGDAVPDGIYRLRVVRARRGPAVDSLKEVVVDTRPPRVRIASAEPT